MYNMPKIFSSNLLRKLTTNIRGIRSWLSPRACCEFMHVFHFHQTGMCNIIANFTQLFPIFKFPP